eukprot:2187714-Prymnesium_polylepis.1
MRTRSPHARASPPAPPHSQASLRCAWAAPCVCTRPPPNRRTADEPYRGTYAVARSLNAVSASASFSAGAYACASLRASFGRAPSGLGGGGGRAMAPSPRVRHGARV